MDDIPQIDLPFYELGIIYVLWIVFGLLVGIRRIREERDLVVSDIICLILVCGLIGWPFKKLIFYFHEIILSKK